MVESASISRRLMERDRFGATPRFGFSNEFSDFFSTQEVEKKSYIKGLLVASLVMMSFFLLWGLFLVASRFYIKVRFLSGSPLPATVLNDKKESVANPWITRFRVAFLLSSVGYAIAVVLATVGIGRLDNTAAAFVNGVELASAYFDNAQSALSNVLPLMDTVQEQRNATRDELLEFVESLHGWNESDMVFAADSLMESMNSWHDFSVFSLDDFEFVLQKGENLADNIFETTNDIDLRILQVVVGMAGVVIPVLLVGCLFWNVYGSTTVPSVANCRDYFLVPVFLAMVLLGIALCWAVLVGVLVNKDFCSGGEDSSVDSTILEILQKQGVDPHSFEVKSVEYVVHGCSAIESGTVYPFWEFVVLGEQLNETIHTMSTFMQEVAETNVETWTNGTLMEETAMLNVLEEMQPSTRELLVAVERFLGAVACRPLYDVYHAVTHDAACSEASAETYSIFVSLLFMSCFGLSVITCRSALYPIVEDDWDLECDKQDDAANGEDAHESVSSLRGKTDSAQGTAAPPPEVTQSHLILYPTSCRTSDPIFDDEF